MIPAQVQTVTHSLSRDAGGLFVSVRRLAQELRTSGIDITVTGLADPHFAQDAAEWAPLQPYAFTPTPPRSLGFHPAMVSRLQKQAQPNSIMHLQGLWKFTSWAAWHAARKTQTPVIISPRGMLDAWALAQSTAQKRIAGLLYENRNLKHAACMHALCDPERAHIRDFGLQNPIAVVPNGVDLPDLSVSVAPPPMPDAIRDRKRCLFMSRIHPKKGLVPLVGAMRQCRDDLRDWVFVIAGPDNGGHRAEVEAQIQSHSLTGHVHWVGPLYGAEKDAWLRHADAFILPSFSEGLPIAVLEAFAYALPAIITPHCNLPTAHTEDAALSVDPTPACIAEGLRHLASLRPEERMAMGHSGRDTVVQHYTWQSVADRMISVYRWMLDAGPAPACMEFA